MCGIIGIIGTPQAAQESYLGLLMLQHRGQDSAGILSFDDSQYEFHQEKNLGQIKDAIPEEKVLGLKGNIAIGHTRYSTIGKIRKEEIQPMLINSPFGMAMVHNGNIINTAEIKANLRNKNKRTVFSHNDLELMLNLYAENLPSNVKDKFSFQDMITATTKLFQGINGGYSVISTLADHGMIAFKDPSGIRPLCFGEKGGCYGLASESKSLEFLGYTNIRELSAGELLFISNEGKVHSKIISKRPSRPCMFEWIYFSNADTNIWNKSVYQMRLRFGQKLAESIEDKDFDIVVPVPDTSRPSAIALSEELGIPYREVLIKNRYSQRTFILNTQKDRENAIKLKMNAVKSEVIGKKILLVDDSIVRGSTSKRIIQHLLDCGATKVSIASTCPPIKKPCYYGIDFPNSEELVAFNRNPMEVARTIGAQDVYYLPIEALKEIFDDLKICTACLDGDYPTDITQTNTMIDKRIKHEEIDLPRLR